MTKHCNGLTQRLELENFPLGHILDPRLGPSQEETDAFKNWTCPHNMEMAEKKCVQVIICSVLMERSGDV